MPRWTKVDGQTLGQSQWKGDSKSQQKVFPRVGTQFCWLENFMFLSNKRPNYNETETQFETCIHLYSTYALPVYC